MEQKLNKEFYTTIGFAVFLFVLAFSFFKEYVFQYHSISGSLFSSIIGFIISFGITWLLKNKSIIQKIVALVICVIFIAVFASNKKTNPIMNTDATKVNIKSVEGNWVAKETGLILKLDISSDKVKMNFYPDNKQLVFEYEIKDQVIDLYNDEDVSYFQWKIIKLTNDSLVVLEKKQILRFKKQR